MTGGLLGLVVVMPCIESSILYFKDKRKSQGSTEGGEEAMIRIVVALVLCFVGWLTVTRYAPPAWRKAWNRAVIAMVAVILAFVVWKTVFP